ncbi:cyclopropane fatty acyl phospholipid synthase [Chloroflexus sp.]|uniref:cyclopropane fatty acyl phospholipid synthase n=1 Tax=Chloroflexus sp. TaxID=1904827 RepID=UPI002617652A|nr:cyclopropane fatty acyl phospholipid synthase [uncultured Chloroflexus sp.]
MPERELASLATTARASRTFSHALNRFARAYATDLLKTAGITVNGSQPWDIQVHDERVYLRSLLGGSLGLGEAYMDGWWDCAAIDEFICRLLRAQAPNQVGWLVNFPLWLDSRLLNRQRGKGAFVIGQRHYDIGNDLYAAMLDRRMIYSCAYWENGARTLDEAQEAKLDLIARKLDLQPGMRVLDIGCGWGGTAQYLAERYGVHVVGITVSQEQAILAQERCRGLPVEIRLEDYRQTRGRFDRIISVGMFEHVGYRNYRVFMRVVRRLLADDGLFLLHTIGTNVAYQGRDAWIERYIFPNSMLPSPRLLTAAFEGLFVLEDWHNFGVNYVTTLKAWHANFEQAWPQLAPRYGERFYRMWRLYLLMSAGSFMARASQLWQLVLSPRGVSGGYRSVR